MEIRAEKAPWYNGVAVLISDKENKRVAQLQWVEVSDVVDSAHTTVLSHENAQVLIDDLWHAGLRPSEGSGSAGSLAATERHLEDMRRLVFRDPTIIKMQDPA